MKYMIETTENGCIETITLSNGKQYSKRHIRTGYGSICEDDEFYEQMEKDGVCEEILDKVCDYIDNSFFTSGFMDIAELDNR